MQQPDFWFKRKTILSDLLLPFAYLYALAGRLRRCARKPVMLAVPLICVGNINVGGTGKTPFCLYLAEMLKREGICSNPYFLTRMGDEAIVLGQAAPVVIGPHRGIAALEAQEKGADLIIMDDGMQNPTVKPDLTFSMVDVRGFGNARVMPAGPLRETLEDAFARIDAFINYDEPVEGKPNFAARVVAKQALAGKKYVAFCGIGNPEKFRQALLKAGADLVGFEVFPDHYYYTEKDLTALREKAQRNAASLITTTKDMAKIEDASIDVLDVEVKMQDEAALIRFIRERLRK